MFEKHIAAIIAFGISALYMLLVVVSFVSGTVTSCSGGVPDDTYLNEVSTEVVFVTEPPSSTEPVEVTPEIEEAPTNNNCQSYSEYEYDLLARTIYQESGICSEYCQWLVGSAVLNLADERGGIENVVFDYNTFNVAYILYDCTPSELSYMVAERLLTGDRDYNVKYFRTDYYHGFGTPYQNVDNVYFSTN